MCIYLLFDSFFVTILPPSRLHRLKAAGIERKKNLFPPFFKIKRRSPDILFALKTISLRHQLGGHSPDDAVASTTTTHLFPPKVMTSEKENSSTEVENESDETRHRSKVLSKTVRINEIPLTEWRPYMRVNPIVEYHHEICNFSTPDIPDPP